MKFIDIFIPINLAAFDAEKRKTIRSYLGFLLVALCVGFAIIVFSRLYSKYQGEHLLVCTMITLCTLVTIALLWAGLVALVRIIMIVLGKTHARQDASLPQTLPAGTPFRGDFASETEAYAVEYLKTHPEKWQRACLYRALDDSLRINHNKKEFYTYFHDKYPELMPTGLRNFQNAVQDVEEGVRNNNSECTNEIERIKKELKVTA